MFTKYEPDRNPTWEKEVGSILEGVYVGKRTLMTENGETRLYTVEKKGGEKIDVWSSATIDNFLGNMPIGTEIQIKYLGKEKSKKGGREYHNFEFGYNKETMPDKDIIDMAHDEFGV